MVYANENSFLANNVRNLIEAQGISTFIKNEFAQGAVGEVSAFDAWPEVWVINDVDFERAKEILKLSQSGTKGDEWVCERCSEKNDPSFEVCWNCQCGNSTKG